MVPVVHPRAYEQYRDEGASWLKDGRMRLIAALLRRHLQPQPHPRELLDLGAGIGVNIEVLRAFGVVDALESNPIGLQQLADNPHVRDVFALELPTPLARRYDVIGAFDVIEHLADDAEAVAWIDDHLKPSGLFVATVPAYDWLFSAHDVALGHFRRYTARRLRHVVGERLRVRQSGYFVSGLFPLAALSRLPSVVRYRLGAAREAAVKQSADVPGPTAAMFAAVLAAEAWLVGKGIDPPFGLSAYAVAERPGI
jgi:SAM-dependent methyltransferase